MEKRVAPSAALEAAIAEMLTEGAGTGDVDRLGEIGRLGARLVLQALSGRERRLVLLAA